MTQKMIEAFRDKLAKNLLFCEIFLSNPRFEVRLRATGWIQEPGRPPILWIYIDGYKISIETALNILEKVQQEMRAKYFCNFSRHKIESNFCNDFAIAFKASYLVHNLDLSGYVYNDQGDFE